ncbi:MAG: hypothetical protein WBA74_13835 [Cyclobacteriaceae bacterium]
MKLTRIKNTLLSLVVLLAIASCGDNKPTENRNTTTSPAPSTSAQKSKESFLYVSDESDNQIAELVLAGNDATINYESRTFFGERKGDKLKYYDQQNNMLYEIKYKENSFKLRDSNSALLWKVKTYDNKIKLADNEEMENPIEIKKKSDNKYVVYRNGEESKVIRIESDKLPININNTYYTRGFTNNYHSAILLMDDFKDLEKYMILVELNR